MPPETIDKLRTATSELYELDEEIQLAVLHFRQHSDLDTNSTGPDRPPVGSFAKTD